MNYFNKYIESILLGFENSKFISNSIDTEPQFFLTKSKRFYTRSKKIKYTFLVMGLVLLLQTIWH